MIKVNGVSKKYHNKEALKPTTLEFKEGTIIGILGPNGSGKSTLLKVLAGEIQATTGNFEIDGIRNRINLKNFVSPLTSSEFLPRWMSIKDCKKHYRDFYKDFNEKKFDVLLKDLDLTEKLKVGELSKGMKSKLNLALTISRDAKLIILDEPLDGVDPVAREEILGMILDSFNEKTTLVITSHLINELERLLDEVYFIRDGAIKYMGFAEELRNEHQISLDELYRETYSTRITEEKLKERRGRLNA